MTFVRYVAVQLVAYGIDIGTFLFLLTFGIFNPLIANVFGKFAAGAFAFLAHRIFTFRVTSSAPVSRQMFSYVALLVLNIPLSSFVLFLLLRVFDSAVATKLVADAICVVFTYVLSKYLVFVKSV